ncbi:interleukin-8-like [Chanodichthys erythropterus]|uniref:interleukin-8-like n=1 Tax=Chanodichthys erythropterus TaxID=933992 RepID=UPI00351F7FE0
MKLTVAALMSLICTAALLSISEGQQPEIYLRCQCIQTHSGPPIRIEKILSLKVIPAGQQCKNEEIIARMNRGQMCLDSKKDWVISIKEKMNKRKVKSQ